MDQQSQTTPFGLWRYARDFADAGDAAYEVARYQPFVPAYYLMGHSIELSLKAFLLGAGVPLDELKRDFGHDLSALLDRAHHLGLAQEVQLSDIDGGVIRLLGFEYRTKRFEYIRTGLLSLPEWQKLQPLTHRLVSSLRVFCKRATGIRPKS
jgi:hypothetical protein